MPYPAVFQVPFRQGLMVRAVPMVFPSPVFSQSPVLPLPVFPHFPGFQPRVESVMPEVLQPLVLPPTVFPYPPVFQAPFRQSLMVRAALPVFLRPALSQPAVFPPVVFGHPFGPLDVFPFPLPASGGAWSVRAVIVGVYRAVDYGITVVHTSDVASIAVASGQRVAGNIFIAPSADGLIRLTALGAEINAEGIYVATVVAFHRLTPPVGVVGEQCSPLSTFG